MKLNDLKLEFKEKNYIFESQLKLHGDVGVSTKDKEEKKKNTCSTLFKRFKLYSTESDTKTQRINIRIPNKIQKQNPPQILVDLVKNVGPLINPRLNGAATNR